MARPRQVSDDDILAAARLCFVEHGPGVSTAVIAERLGVSQPALFKRFASKRQLMVAALVPPAVPGWINELETGPDGRPFREQLADFSDRVAAFFAELSPRMSCLRASGIPPNEVMAHYDVPPAIAAVQGMSAWLRRCHTSGLIRSVDFDAVAKAMLGALHIEAFLAYVTGQRLNEDSQRAYLVEFVDLYARALEPGG